MPPGKPFTPPSPATMPTWNFRSCSPSCSACEVQSIPGRKVRSEGLRLRRHRSALGHPSSGTRVSPWEDRGRLCKPPFGNHRHSLVSWMSGAHHGWRAHMCNRDKQAADAREAEYRESVRRLREFDTFNDFSDDDLARLVRAAYRTST